MFSTKLIYMDWGDRVGIILSSLVIFPTWKRKNIELPKQFSNLGLQHSGNCAAVAGGYREVFREFANISLGKRGGPYHTRLMSN